jgi:hypothetical protein
MTMKQVSRRTFGKKTLLFSMFTAISFPGKAMGFLDKMEKDKFLQREDLADAVKSLYMTYDAFNHYPHKFNDVVSKSQLRSLQFHINNGLEKEYVDHYLYTMKPLLKRIKKMVDSEGSEKGLSSMFEDTSCSYQLMERIYVKPGERSFTCPYKELLGYCKTLLGTFPMELNDVCTKWCLPTWTGFAEEIGIKISVQPGDVCMVKLAGSDSPPQ